MKTRPVRSGDKHRSSKNIPFKLPMKPEPRLVQKKPDKRSRPGRWIMRSFPVVSSMSGVTGIGLLWIVRFAVPDDPFAVIGHPWEPIFRDTHILVAPIFLILAGYLFRDHFQPKLQDGTQRGKWSGLLTAAFIFVQCATGYWMQVTIDLHFREILFWAHAAAGIGFLVFIALHLVRARKGALSKITSFRFKPARFVRFLLLALIFSPAAVAESRSLSPAIERHVYLMGTEAVIRVWSESRAEALRTADRLIRIMETTEMELSSWKPASVISQINSLPSGSVIRLDGRLCSLFSAVRFWNRETEGSFNPAIGDLLVHWGLKPSPGGEGTRVGLTRTPTAPGTDLGFVLVSDEQSCRISRTSPRAIDTGGFGKGEALDRALHYSEDNDLKDRWMINLGGQIMVYRTPPEGRWVSLVAHPAQRYLGIVRVGFETGSLATSGMTRNGELEGRRISHLVDPSSGQPVEFQGSVLVWHEEALAADILSTALFVMGPNRGPPWAEARGISCCFIQIENDGLRVMYSKSFEKLIIPDPSFSAVRTGSPE